MVEEDVVRRIGGARIDVPLRTTCAYLFVDPPRESWDPWWVQLYRYLIDLAPPMLNWKHEPVQDIFTSRPPLTDEQKFALLHFLRTAPAAEIESHRTLRRAVELADEAARRLDVMYFATADEE